MLEVEAEMKAMKEEVDQLKNAGRSSFSSSAICNNDINLKILCFVVIFYVVWVAIGNRVVMF